MLIQFIAVFLMLLGLALIVIPKFHGALIILAGCVLYMIDGFGESPSWLLPAASGLAIISECSVIAIAHYLTRKFKTVPELSADTAAGNIAGIIVTDALFGLFGTVAFETVISRTILPRLDTMAKVFSYMAIGALFRLVCGLVMIFLVLTYL